MIVPSSGHQVRCIPWVQMGTFNKEIRFLCGLKFFVIEYILWGIPTIKSTFDVANMVKTVNVKDVPINNDALLNIQACQINVWQNRVPLISIRVSAHCQAILLYHSRTIRKLVDLITALRQSDCRIYIWVSAKTVHSSSTNHG